MNFWLTFKKVNELLLTIKRANKAVYFQRPKRTCRQIAIKTTIIQDKPRYLDCMLN